MKWFLSIFLFLAQSSFSKTMLFDVEGKLFLAGSIHVLSWDDYPLPKAFEYAIQNADELWLELTLEQLSDPNNSKVMAKYMVGDTTISSQLTKPLKTRYLAMLNKYGMSLNEVDRLTPMGLQLVVLQQQIKALELDAPGLDRYMGEHPKKLKQMSFETFQEQMDILSVLNEMDVEQSMQMLLHDDEQSTRLFELMRKNWRLGDVDWFQKELIDEMKRLYPKMYQRVLVDRNHRWLDEIKKQLLDPETELVVVGALHLIGEHGLISLLQQEGYAVSQVLQ